ncbi:damage-inducible protein D [Xanthomonas nasturtii]|nr:BRO family protein [Xanthomonas nasturtii]MCL1498473.1 damage-inducible protein D [Xanthomonas nasturtii]MCL1502043.1 damage-inducible protein D [Xanthomonas nasturtii]MCL1521677.1 damage-inducible protein D [Xanthomonas nasturtii]MCL1530826.1 damage-inducible protein D [Xanthomonas nasturtii]MCL1551392.1 damage-inducible protein D [Xanthomonas nasturtii]
MSDDKQDIAMDTDNGFPAQSATAVRRTWHEGRWWFAVIDVVAALSDSENPENYLRNLRRRDEELSSSWDSLVRPLRVTTPGGPQQLNCTTLEGALRIIQSIPSPKAEPFKRWLARIGNERIQGEEAADFDALSENQRRLFLRDQISQHNKDLAAAAKQAGVETPLEYAVFQDHGYKGLYGGLGAKDIHARKALKKSQKILDHMGSTELAANLFRATQAEEKLRRDNVHGKTAANRTHYAVGQTVRKTIEELGGTLPEHLPTPQTSIKRLQKDATPPLGQDTDDDQDAR